MLTLSLRSRFNFHHQPQPLGAWAYMSQIENVGISRVCICVCCVRSLNESYFTPSPCQYTKRPIASFDEITFLSPLFSRYSIISEMKFFPLVFAYESTKKNCSIDNRKMLPVQQFNDICFCLICFKTNKN